jgi:hypothetical protein
VFLPEPTFGTHNIQHTVVGGFGIDGKFKFLNNLKTLLSPPSSAKHRTGQKKLFCSHAKIAKFAAINTSPPLKGL